MNKVLRNDMWNGPENITQDEWFIKNIKPYLYTRDLDKRTELIEDIISIGYEEEYGYEFKYPNLSIDNKFIFTHIPKCAGNSINSVLNIPDQGHFDLRTVQNILSPELYNNAIKFTIVRNPFDRIVSLYSMRKNKALEGIEWYYDIEFNPNMSFEDWWWDLRIRAFDRFSPPTSRTMLEMITDNSGNIGVDYILKYENLENDWNDMFDDLKMEAPSIPHLNFSNHVNYREYYECGTGGRIKDIIYNICEEDLNYFKYDF